MPDYEVELDLGTVKGRVYAPDVDEALRRAKEYALGVAIRAAVENAQGSVREIEAEDVRL